MDVPVVFLSAYIVLQVIGFLSYLRREDYGTGTVVVSLAVIMGLIWAVGSLAIR